MAAASLESLLLALGSAGISHGRNGFNNPIPGSLRIQALMHGARRRRRSPRKIRRAIVPIAWARRNMISTESHVERQVQTLRRLVPNGASVGLNGLFRDAADYISCLQQQVQVMKFIVSMLSEKPN